MMAVLGLDVGGSKTRGIVVDAHTPDTVLADVLGKSANVASLGPAVAGANLLDVLGQLPDVPVGAVCVGAAGAGSAAVTDQFRAWIGEAYPGAAVTITHDGELLLAAAGWTSGIALIAGTGSLAWGRAEDGSQARAGGWGYILGDEGGGYGLAKEAVRAALWAHDRGLPPSAVTRSLFATLAITSAPELLTRFYAQPERAFWARRSQDVFDAAASGDSDAQGLIQSGAHALAEIAEAVADRLGIDGPVVLGGGLLQRQQGYAELVIAELDRRRLSGSQVLKGEPAMGAARIAASLLR